MSLTPPPHRLIDAIRDYLDNGLGGGELKRADRALRQQWVREALEHVGYENLNRDDRGFVRQYLQRVTGYSRAAIERHISAFRSGAETATVTVADPTSDLAASPIEEISDVPAVTPGRARAVSSRWAMAALTASTLIAFGAVRSAGRLPASVVAPAQPTPMLFAVQSPSLSQPARVPVPTWIPSATPVPTFAQRIGQRRDERVAHPATPVTSTRPVASQLLAALNIAGSPSDGQFVMFKNGKAVWGDLPSDLVRGADNGRTSGIGRKPTGGGSAPTSDSTTGSSSQASGGSSGGSRGGGGSGNSSGGGGSVTNITNITSGLDQSTSDSLYVNVDGDDMTGALNIVATGVGLSISDTASGSHIHAENILTSSGTFIVEGAAIFGSTVRFNGVTYTFPTSDGSGSGRILATNGAGQLSWTSVAGSSGISQSAADGRFVNIGGDTMTGGLLIAPLGGAIDSGLALEIVGTASGRILHAQDQLRSSGGLIVQTTGLFKGNLTTRGIASGSELYASALLRSSGSLSVQGASNLKGAVTFGSTINVTGNATFDTNTLFVDSSGNKVGILTAAPKTALEVLGTMSGSEVHATSQLRSSGSLSVNGAATFKNSSFRLLDSGFANCTSLETVGGVLTCGTDDGTSYFAGQGLTLNGSNAFSLSSSFSGTSLEIMGTSSGRQLYAADVLRSSGTLIVQSIGLFKGNLTTRGIASGSELYASALLRSSGSLSVQGATNLKSTLNVTGNATFDTNTLFVDSSGNKVGILTAAPKTALEVIGAMSGSELIAASVLRSSGSLSVQGTTNLKGTVKLSGLNCTGNTNGGALTAGADGTISCSDDDSGGSSVSAGQGLTLVGSVLSLSSSFSGTSLEIMGTSSGRIVHAMDQLRSSGTLIVQGAANLKSTLSVTGNATFDTNTLFVDSSGNKVGILTTAPKTALEVLGTMSGSEVFATSKLSTSGSLIVGGTVKLKGLNCTGNTNGGAITAGADGTLSCTDDDSGGGSSGFGTGNVLTIANKRYVSVQGDTMTGGLLIHSTNDDTKTIDAGLLLEIAGTASGRVFHAQDGLRSSGTLIVQSTGLFKGNLTTRGIASGSELYASSSLRSSGGLIIQSTGLFKGNLTTRGIASGSELYASALLRSSGSLSVQGATNLKSTLNVTGNATFDTNTLFVDSSGNKVGILTTAPKTALEVLGTMSGSEIHAATKLVSSGSLLVNGTVKLKGLNCTGNTNGGALTAGADGTISCSDDDSGGSSVSAGQGLTLVGSVLSLSSSFSGTSLEIMGTSSGRQLYAADVLRSSGTLIVQSTGLFKGNLTTRGIASGSELYASARLRSSGSLSIQGATNLKGAATFGSTLTLNGVTYTFPGGDGSASGKVLKTNGAGVLSWSADNNTVTAVGQGLSLSSGLLTLRSTISGSLVRFTTISGATLFAKDKLYASGALVVKNYAGTATGNILIVDTKGLVYDATNKNVGIGTLNTAAAKLNVAGTMSGRSLFVTGTGAAPLIAVYNPTGSILVGTGAVKSGTGGFMPQLYVTGRATARVGSGSTGVLPTGLAVQGRYAYVTNSGSSTLQVFDVTNAVKPLIKGSVSTGTNPRSVAVQGRYAYVTNSGSSTFQVFDTSNPAAPLSMGTVATQAGPTGIALQGRYAYITNANRNMMQVIDIANPYAPRVVGSGSTGVRPISIVIQDRYAYVVNNGGNSLQVIDVSNPIRPIVVGTVTTGTAPRAVAVQGRYAYVVNGGDASFQVIDVSSSASPAVIGVVTTGSGPRAVSVQGRYAYVTNASSSTLQTIDISNPWSPSILGSVATGGAPQNVVAQGRYAYVINGNDKSIHVHDLGGAYEQQMEAGGIEAASVNIRNGLSVLDADVRGALTINRGFLAQGQSAIINTSTGASAYALSILSNTGALRVSVRGNGATSNAPNIQFGSGDIFDVNLYRGAANRLQTDDAFWAGSTISGSALTIMGQVTPSYFLGNLGIGKSTTPKTALEVLGTMSGSTLFATSKLSTSGSLIVGGTVKLKGLNCTGNTNGGAITAAADGTLSCTDDDSGAGGSSTFGTGNVLTIANKRYVSVQGDTMTGGLLIHSRNDDTKTVDAGLLLEVAGTASGNIIHAQKLLTSSGALVVDGVGNFHNVINVGGAQGYSYNVFASTSSAGTTLTSHSLSSPGDVYIQNMLEIDGQTYADGTMTVAGAFTAQNTTTLSSTVTLSATLNCTNGLTTTAGGVVGCSSTTAWKTTGNTGTTPSSNFLGTLDDNDLAFRRNNTEVMRIASYSPASSSSSSSYGVGIGTSSPQAKLQVTGGGLCVGSDDNCNNDNDVEGIIYSSSTAMTVYDVAEMYPTTDLTLAAAEIVSLDPVNGVFVRRAQTGDAQLLGIISARPGVLLGGFNGEQFRDEHQVAIALSGRVPVNIVDEGGDVHIGDELTLSSIDGVAKKAKPGDRTIGYALQAFSGSTMGQVLVFVRTGRAAIDALTESGGVVIAQALRANDLLASSGSLVVAQGGFFGSGVLIKSATANAGQNLLAISSNVNGANDTVFRVTAGGNVAADGAFTGGGADYAEWFLTADTNLKFGEAVCVDVTRANSVRRCTRDGDADIVGLVSSKKQAAFIGNKFSGAEDLPVPGTVLVGLLGQLSADMIVGDSSSAIRPGDPLAAGVTPGTLRKAKPGEATVGVALEGLDAGRAMKKVLISRKNQSLTVEAVEQQTLESIKAMKIEDEVGIMVQSTLDELNVDANIRQEVQKQLSQSTLEARITELEARIDALSGSLVTREAVAQSSSSSSSSSQTAAGDLVASLIKAQSLTLDESITAKDARVLGDLYVDGMVHVEDFYAPNGMRIDGGLRTSTLDVASDAIVNGTLTLNGALNLTNGMTFGTGTTLSAHDLLVRGALRVIGPITIEGLAEFLGDVHITGELHLSSRQAGFAEIAATGSSVAVRFDPPLSGEPILTVTPNGRVGTEWWTESASVSGFTIMIDHPLGHPIRFSWIAMVSGDGMSVPVAFQADLLSSESSSSSSSESSVESSSSSSEAAVEEPEDAPQTGTPFPVDELGVPVSSNEAWNSCIRGNLLIRSDGTPVNCWRYRDGYVWEHPDLHINFTYNTSVSPAILQIPEGYVVTPQSLEPPAEAIEATGSSSSSDSANSDSSESSESVESSSGASAVPLPSSSSASSASAVPLPSSSSASSESSTSSASSVSSGKDAVENIPDAAPEEPVETEEPTAPETQDVPVETPSVP